MKLKKGWVTEQILGKDIIRIATPFVKPNGDHIMFIATSEWLSDDRDFWFEVQNRQNEMDIEEKIKPVLENYCIQFLNKKVCCRVWNDFLALKQTIYNFGEALNELYKINFESEG